MDEGELYKHSDEYFCDRSTPELKKHKDYDVFCYDDYVLTLGITEAIKAVAPYAFCNEPILIEGADGASKETLTCPLW